MRITTLMGCAGLWVGCMQGRPADQVFAGGAGRWVDLSHPFSESTVYWPTAEPFHLDTVSYGVTEGGWFYAAFNFSAAEHGGTHLDAPVHFAAKGLAADQIPLSRLIGPAAVVDVSEHSGPDYLVTPADLEAWEAAHGPIPTGAIVLIRTGWGSRYGDREAYLGTDAVGPEAVKELHFPGVSPDGARWILEHGGISAVGIDTPSLDFGQSTTFETHQILYGADIPGFENVAALEELPESGAYVVALPMKIKGGSGAPLRIVAFVPDL